MWFKLELEALDRTRPTAMNARLSADTWRRLMAARMCASESACFVIPHDLSNMSVRLSVHSMSTETQSQVPRARARSQMGHRRLISR